MTQTIKDAMIESGTHESVMRSILDLLRKSSEQRKAGQLDEALQHCQEASDLAREHLGERHRAYGHCLEDLGLLYEQKGDDSNARLTLEQAFDILLAELGNEAPEVLGLFSRLNHLYYY